MIFLGEIISRILLNWKSALATPCASLALISVVNIFKRSLDSVSGISVIQFWGIFSGFVRLDGMVPVAASHQEYTTGVNFSRNSSKLETNSSSLISLILSSSRLLFPRTSPTKVSRLSRSGLISANSIVLFVCVIVSMAITSSFYFDLLKSCEQFLSTTDVYNCFSVQ